MTGTCETMPCHQWVSAVLDAAHVSVEDMERIVTRARLHAWFDAGETIETAAKSLRTWVTLNKQQRSF